MQEAQQLLQIGPGMLVRPSGEVLCGRNLNQIEQGVSGLSCCGWWCSLCPECESLIAGQNPKPFALNPNP